MAIFSGVSYKNSPKAAIDYITRSDKAVIVSQQFLHDEDSYATQMRDTARRFGKNTKASDRTYYSFVISPKPSDNPTAEQSHQLAEAVARKLFPNFEAVIATHGDTDDVHSHIILNSVNFEDGKKLQIARSLKGFESHEGSYGWYKDQVQVIAKEIGLTPTDWRGDTTKKRTKEREGKQLGEQHSRPEQAIQYRSENKGMDWGELSWKENLRRWIDHAKDNTASRIEFEEYLKENAGITMPRNTDKTVSFTHPNAKDTIRGNKLGDDYTAKAIDVALEMTSRKRDFNHEYETARTARNTATERINTADSTASDSLGRLIHESARSLREEQVRGQQELREQAKRDATALREREQQATRNLRQDDRTEPSPVIESRPARESKPVVKKKPKDRGAR